MEYTENGKREGPYHLQKRLCIVTRFFIPRLPVVRRKRHHVFFLLLCLFLKKVYLFVIVVLEFLVFFRTWINERLNLCASLHYSYCLFLICINYSFINYCVFFFLISNQILCVASIHTPYSYPVWKVLSRTKKRNVQSRLVFGRCEARYYGLQTPNVNTFPESSNECGKSVKVV